VLFRSGDFCLPEAAIILINRAVWGVLSNDGKLAGVIGIDLKVNFMSVVAAYRQRKSEASCCVIE
jgi:hypothetical protein